MLQFEPSDLVSTTTSVGNEQIHDQSGVTNFIGYSFFIIGDCVSDHLITLCETIIVHCSFLPSHKSFLNN